MPDKIAVTTSSFAKYDRRPIGLLEKRGFKVVFNRFGRQLFKSEIPVACKGCVGIIAGTEEYDRTILKRLSGLSVISRCGAGTGNIDKRTAGELGIKIVNTPDGPTRAVAELTVGLILNMLRRVSLMDSEIRGKRWKKTMGNLLCGKKVGMVGFGRIGRLTCDLLRPFGCEAAYSDPVAGPPGRHIRRMPLSKLLGWADIVSIHVSSSEELIGRKEIGMMRKGAWLVNTSRGKVVDEEALYEALKGGKLSGAAIDVFAKEPYAGILRKLDNIILTPHIGSYAVESRVGMEYEAARNLLGALGYKRS